jgi:hypothetical protein
MISRDDDPTNLLYNLRDWLRELLVGEYSALGNNYAIIIFYYDTSLVRSIDDNHRLFCVKPRKNTDGLCFFIGFC